MNQIFMVALLLSAAGILYIFRRAKYSSEDNCDRYWLWRKPHSSQGLLANEDNKLVDRSQSKTVSPCIDSNDFEPDLNEQAAHMREIREGVNMRAFRVPNRFRLSDIFSDKEFFRPQDDSLHKTA
eukprot:CAMPEP_0114276170 /NCGR_PEP_ID=MMETSP0059-20121206/93_1 /TAXON_ID=36894 /ORGANISM="Pyramimonas parkeae, Strain CCMP726" /LENGTH=124 /DNA_ID=CAMNT_0001396149 /DNA_START=296 /DNA_END=670 /DNA_ORIENTATION=+